MTTTLPPRSTHASSGSGRRAGGSGDGVGGGGDGSGPGPFSPPQGWSAASVGEWLRSPVAPYYLIAVSAATLTILGLVMVLSASGPGSYLESGSSYTVFLSQVLYAGVGVVFAVVGSRVPVRVWRRLAWPAIFLALCLQLAVFSPIGMEFQGNRGWITIGGRSLQPAEMGKVALVLLGASLLTTKRRLIHRPAHVVVPLIFPFAAVLIGLVMAGGDLGTALVMISIVVGLLWAAGVPAKWFAALGAVVAAGVAYLAVSSGYRMQRIQVWLGDICHSPHVDGCFQKVHAEYALADGGWWGVGLGGSREKWGLLPEPHNDFILAIIGEELGLPGTLAVLGLFAVLAYSCFRIISQSEDNFARLAASGVMIWFMAQALLNVGSVIGMLPIIGVPLPLVSSGGSALIAALMGVGLLLSLARSLPQAQAGFGGRASMLRRTIAAVPSRAAAPPPGAAATSRGSATRAGAARTATSGKGATSGKSATKGTSRATPRAGAPRRTTSARAPHRRPGGR